MTKDLGIGIIGTGFMGKAHAFAYRAALAAFPDIPVPRLEMIGGDAGYRPKRLGDPAGSVALADPTIAGFVGWARFPYAEIERAADGSARVWILDARYVRTPPALGARSFGAARVEVPSTSSP